MIDNCALINTCINLFLSKCMDVDIYLFIHSFVNMAGLVLHSRLHTICGTNSESKKARNHTSSSWDEDDWKYCHILLCCDVSQKSKQCMNIQWVRFPHGALLVLGGRCNDGQATGRRRRNCWTFFYFPLENKSKHCLQALVWTYSIWSKA